MSSHSDGTKFPSTGNRPEPRPPLSPPLGCAVPGSPRGNPEPAAGREGACGVPGGGSGDPGREPRSEKRRRESPLVRRREVCRAAWASVCYEVAERWDRLFAGREDPPWLDLELDEELQFQVREAILRGDLDETKEVARRWRRAWDSILQDSTDERT